MIAVVMVFIVGIMVFVVVVLVVVAAVVVVDAVVVDVALPGTVTGRAPDAMRILAGEALSLPAGWRRGALGTLYHCVAGYGPWQVFACVVEPLVQAALGRNEPFAIGRSVAPETVREFGRHASAMGFQPRLSEGWRIAKGLERPQIGQSE